MWNSLLQQTNTTQLRDPLIFLQSSCEGKAELMAMTLQFYSVRIIKDSIVNREDAYLDYSQHIFPDQENTLHFDKSSCLFSIKIKLVCIDWTKIVNYQ